MKKLIVKDWGSMQNKEGKIKPPGEEEVSIEIKYAGVGFADVMAVLGKYILAPRKPFSPGYEFFGSISAIGKGVKDLSIGQRVCGMLPTMGAYKQSITVDAIWVIPVPNEVSDEVAGLLPLNYITAMSLMEKTGKVQKGDKILIQGAAGGVGTAVLEMGKELGATIYGTASLAKHELIRTLNGVPIDYKTKNWVRDFRVMVPGGVDLAFDAFGIKAMNQCWKVLSKKGKLVSYGFSSKVTSSRFYLFFAILSYLSKKIFGFGKSTQICGAPSIIKEDTLWYRKTMMHILSLAATGKINPVLYKKISWKDADKAHEEIRNSKARGKIILDFSV